jgi:hypothetical protein
MKIKAASIIVSLALGLGALPAVSQADQPSAPAVSNVMKTKHDTVKNSVSNIR